MTKEEAKKELSKMIFELGFEDNVDDKVYALNMAIQALSQEPCTDAVKVCEIYADVNDCENGAQELCGQCIHYKEPCDDAISRDMALEKMADYVVSGYADSVEDFEEYSRIICQLPSVTHKSGKWLEDFDEHNPRWFKCSNCEDLNAYKCNFCPNCGARMESEGTDADSN